MRDTVELKYIVEQDTEIKHINFEVVENPKDPNHLERKQQQRGIHDVQILIALNYGVKKRTFQNISYTITDRSLMGTTYYNYIDKLRGLTIIGDWEGSCFHIITSFWNFTIKNRKRF